MMPHRHGPARSHRLEWCVVGSFLGALSNFFCRILDHPNLHGEDSAHHGRRQIVPTAKLLQFVGELFLGVAEWVGGGHSLIATRNASGHSLSSSAFDCSMKSATSLCLSSFAWNP